MILILARRHIPWQRKKALRYYSHMFYRPIAKILVSRRRDHCHCCERLISNKEQEATILVKNIMASGRLSIHQRCNYLWSHSSEIDVPPWNSLSFVSPLLGTENTRPRDYITANTIFIAEAVIGNIKFGLELCTATISPGTMNLDKIFLRQSERNRGDSRSSGNLLDAGCQRST